MPDRRHRYRKWELLWGYYGLTYWPEGRAYALGTAQARTRLQQPFTGEECARWIENAMFAQRGPVPLYKHWRGVRFLDNHSAFIREKGWQVGFSVNPVVVNPNQPYMLDYQHLLSIWHEDLGIIVPGSQDKSQPEHNTFHTGRKDALGVLYGGRIGTACNPRWVDAFYANRFTGQLESKITAKGDLELRAVAGGNLPKEDVRFNLPFYLGIGANLRINDKPLKLTKRKQVIAIPAGATITAFDDRLKLHCQRRATLYFPCLPFESYHADHKADMDKAFLRLETSLNKRNRTAEFRFTIHRS